MALGEPATPINTRVGPPGPGQWAGGWVVLLALALGPRAAAAQKYHTAAGLRLGSPYGITVQQTLVPRVTLEGIAGLASREVTGTVLGEYHFGILGRSLNYYLGAGGHVGNNKDTGGFGGFDGIVGIEYKFPFLPIVLSYDFKPSVELHNDDWARFPSAFSVRYVLVKQRNKTIGERARTILHGSPRRRK